MSNKIFHRYCESALTVLQSQYETTRVLQHNSTAGSIREQIIKDFLSDHLPELVTLLSGQIFDSEDRYSKQQDIVLVLKSMPRLPFASDNDLIFQDGVVSTIEIKTDLNGTVLRSVGENIASVRALKSNVAASAQMGITHNFPNDKILTAIATYGGSKLDTHIDELTRFQDNQKPDLLLDLNQGLLINVSSR